MGIRAIVVSLALHAGAAMALSRVVRPPLREPPPPLALLEVKVLAPPPAAASAAAPTAPAAPVRPRPGAVASSTPRRSSPARASEPTPAPAPPPASGGGGVALMRMRAPAAAPASSKDEVVVPRPWDLGGGPVGAPPRDQLPPGALTGPVRAPKPYVPGGDLERRELGHGVTPDGDGGYREDRAGYQSRIDRDGSIHFNDKSWDGIDGPAGIGIAGHFDLADAAMRAMGDDPYAYEKMKIMEETREARAGMARRERSDRYREAQHKMTAYLDKVWSVARWSPAQRRRALFALWDEAAEDGDAELVRAGAMARATIVAFVRRRLPEGSPDAFPAAELEAMNRARKSRARFDPYAR